MANYKIFNGKRYRWDRQTNSKRTARSRATHLKKYGEFFARVVAEKGWFVVYKRKNPSYKGVAEYIRRRRKK